MFFVIPGVAEKDTQLVFEDKARPFMVVHKGKQQISGKRQSCSFGEAEKVGFRKQFFTREWLGTGTGSLGKRS